jgi:hypothetical protein
VGIYGISSNSSPFLVRLKRATLPSIVSYTSRDTRAFRRSGTKLVSPTASNRATTKLPFFIECFLGKMRKCLNQSTSCKSASVVLLYLANPTVHVGRSSSLPAQEFHNLEISYKVLDSSALKRNNGNNRKARVRNQPIT